MLTEKTNKGHSASESHVTTPHQQQSDLQHLSLMIQQFSSQLNLMFSQEQQQQQQQKQQKKHSDIDFRDDTMDSKQEQPCYTDQHQTLHYPVNVPHHHLPLAHSLSNFCNNNVGSCSKIISNSSEHHCHLTRLSTSLSTLLPLQHHYAPTCSHGTVCQNHHHHIPHASHFYHPCTLSMMHCCHHSSSHQCTTALSHHQMNSTTSPLTPTGNTALEYSSHQHHRNTIPNTIIGSCPPSNTAPKVKSRTDPLPAIPNGDDGDDDDKATVENQDAPPLNTGGASSPNLVSPIPQPFLIAENSPWTDLYRQDILAKQDTLISSYNNLDNIHITSSNPKTKENTSRSNRSHLREWWTHGKYKWKQLRKKSHYPFLSV